MKKMSLPMVLFFFMMCFSICAEAETTMEKLCGNCQMEEFSHSDDAKLIEGPIMDKEMEYLWIVDYETGWISKISPDGKQEKIFKTIGPLGLEFHKNGTLYGAFQQGIFCYNPKTKNFSDYVINYQGAKFRGPNDLIFDQNGGIYFTDSWDSSAFNPRGCVYYISPDKKVTKIIDNMAFPNGIALSPDFKTLYISDFSKNSIWSAPILEPGVIDSNYTHVMTYLNGGMGPDGIAVDEEGNVYVAHYDAGEIAVLTDKGKIIGYIKIPEGGKPGVTNMAFGGKDKKTLYITESLNNIIYQVKMNVKGAKLFRDE